MGRTILLKQNALSLIFTTRARDNHREEDTVMRCRQAIGLNISTYNLCVHEPTSIHFNPSTDTTLVYCINDVLVERDLVCRKQIRLQNNKRPKACEKEHGYA
jgi:hypothetical protein